jgi:hypothetical protein
MNTSALVIMLTVQLSVAIMTVYMFVRMFKVKPDKENSEDEQ